MKIILSICLFLSSLFSCQQKQAFKSVSVTEFAKLIENQEMQRLDVRTPAEYKEGHIPGSINIDVLEETEFLLKSDSLLKKEQPIALYCRSGRRSKKAAQLLTEKGFTVYELDKGFNGWKAAGKELE